MEKKERSQIEKKLLLADHNIRKKILSYPEKDTDIVQKMLIQDLEFENGEKRYRKYGILAAMANEYKGKASVGEKRFLKKLRNKIKKLDEIVDAFVRLSQFNIIFLIHKNGADFIEAAEFVDKYSTDDFSREEYVKDSERLRQNRKKIN